jgi:hypothetical protein
VRELQPGDVLVVTGMGHETDRIIGRSRTLFFEHEVIVAAVRDTESGTETQTKRQPEWATAASDDLSDA